MKLVDLELRIQPSLGLGQAEKCAWFPLQGCVSGAADVTMPPRLSEVNELRATGVPMCKLLYELRAEEFGAI